MRPIQSMLRRILNAKLRHWNFPSWASGSHRRFSAGEKHDQIGQRKDDQHYNFSGALFRPLPAPQVGFKVGGVGALRQSEAPGGARPAHGRRGMRPRRVGALTPPPGAAPGPGPAADWTAPDDPAVSRDEIGSGGASCAPELALYAEPPAGPLTMGGASAPALGRS